MSQKRRILEMLAAAQPQGVTNRRLNDEVCFRYSGRIMELRREGFKIKSQKIRTGLWLFRLVTPKSDIDWAALRPKPQAYKQGALGI